MTLLAILYLLAAATSIAVVLTQRIVAQAILLSFYSLVLTMIFMVLKAPDVALSELVVGAAAMPLVVLLGAIKTRAKEAK